MGVVVIVGYKPRKGTAEKLDELMRTHHQLLRKEGLVTDRAAIIMKAANGTVLEVFEWKSADAIEKAHSNASVLAMWDEYAEVCDFVPVASVPETSVLFSEFAPAN